jgi:ATP-dependent Clp protease ATP-binding subunit ClpA
MYLDCTDLQPELSKGGTGMFERLTDRARRVAELAQEEARTLNHHYVGTEHLLLGLIHEGEGVAAQVLESLGISMGAVRPRVEEIIGQGEQPPSGRIPFTPRAKKALQLARREALALGHTYIGTEHILLGLLREGDGVAARVLGDLNVDSNQVRQHVIRLLTGRQDGRRSGKAGLPPEILERVDSIDAQLSAIGHRLGAGPDTGHLDQQISQSRRAKEAAAGEEDYENAAALRDQERELLNEKAARQQQWAAEHLDLASLTAELRGLGEDVGRLRDLLRQRGSDPQTGAA